MRHYWRANGKTWMRSYAISLAFSAFFSLFWARGQVPAWLAILSFGLLMPTGALAMSTLMPLLRSRSFLLTVMLQVLVITLCMGAAFASALHVCIAYANGKSPLDLSQIRQYAPIFVTETPTGITFRQPVYSMGMAVMLTFIVAAVLQVSKKLGPGVLRNWVFGKYHNPREEERIFMFLDLKDSTTLAEQLGNIQFSALVRDFFAAMTRACAATGAEVSHYIGDEAVLSWLPKRGLKQANCLRFFTIMGQSIQDKRQDFMDRYGVIPEFKAGVHIGKVVATEVGEIKSEIVFHGDVMNTTARITGLCSTLGEDLLISGDLAEALRPQTNFSLLSHGFRSLKGKVTEVEVFSVRPVG